MTSPNSETDLSRIYAQRFAANLKHRKRVWSVLTRHFFQKYISEYASVLDLGCGYGEFINQIRAGHKYAMDLNPDAPGCLNATIKFLQQDCSQPWSVRENSLDVIFTSNFFEHLPNKEALGRTLDQAYRALRKGGQLIAMGPNIKLIPGTYWDFWDHYLPLTEAALAEALKNRGFQIKRQEAAFLPYTMSGKKPSPLIFVRLYLLFPLLWRILGKQFLVIAVK